MIKCDEFYGALLENRIEYFCGVPDSLLKNICAYITDNAPPGRNVIAANEGAATAMAAGWYLASGNPALVYMQNSGIGNAVNPFLSLADPAVYGIPMILLVGWRGEPGTMDEPQHVKQGELTLPLLEALGITCTVIDGSTSSIRTVIADAAGRAKKDLKPYAIIARKNSFDSFERPEKEKEAEKTLLSREEAVILAAELAGRECAIVSTTGMISRELFEYRERKGEPHDSDFLTVGSMGHSSQIAFGIAAARPGKKIFCFDGDGAVIMHMGSLAINGTQASQDFAHIVFNNGSHESVGGQPTAGKRIKLVEIARSCGYRQAWHAETEDEIRKAFDEITKGKGPFFLEIVVRKGARPDLGRPTLPPWQQKEKFMDYLGK